MNIVEDLESRGLVADNVGELPKIFSKPRTVYFGIDPTADSAQVGNLAVILLMKRLGLAGNKLIFLVGGATGMIGDPREKGERSLLDSRTLASNTRAIKRQLKKILGKTPFTMVDNASWLTRVKLIPFLRDIGKYFTVNDLIKRDIIRKRLETPNESISYTEFTYALLQGYDYLTLNEKYGCNLQVGGSDQWTNMLSGVDLIRKKKGGQAYAISIPLVTDISGKKFGKSEGNAIWLDSKKTSPFVFYQFWINLPDDGLETYLKYYTFLSIVEIQALMVLHERNPGERSAQNALASRVTEIVHGKAVAQAVAQASSALFGSTHFSALSTDARKIVQKEAPTLRVDANITVIEALTKSGLANSKNDARRLIEGKGISLNRVLVEADKEIKSTAFENGMALLKKGKRDILVLILI
ncbi:Tyrosyl-tRNA synthetase [hydrothermal vent metagenome]|uniref:tyrosine--tRNA ligase n=1 Tax=hydrothermal vent metagenome TaxID=652676 RepID=A0A3B0V5N7_9ZZZZ